MVSDTWWEMFDLSVYGVKRVEWGSKVWFEVREINGAVALCSGNSGAPVKFRSLRRALRAAEKANREGRERRDRRESWVD